MTEHKTKMTLDGIRAKIEAHGSNQIQNLSQSAKKRADRLTAMIERLKAGKNVQNRMLKTWLTDDEYAEFESGWVEQLDVRVELKEKPEKVKRYEELIRIADFQYNKRNYGQADRRYEAALEHLQEIIAEDRSLTMWFDRNTDWSADGELGLCPESVPRCKTSRSKHANGGGIVTREKLSKREFKIQALERVIHYLTDNTKVSTVTSSKLTKLLSTDV